MPLSGAFGDLFGAISHLVQSETTRLVHDPEVIADLKTGVNEFRAESATNDELVQLATVIIHRVSHPTGDHTQVPPTVPVDHAAADEVEAAAAQTAQVLPSVLDTTAPDPAVSGQDAVIPAAAPAVTDNDSANVQAADGSAPAADDSADAGQAATGITVPAATVDPAAVVAADIPAATGPASDAGAPALADPSQAADNASTATTAAPVLPVQDGSDGTTPAA